MHEAGMDNVHVSVQVGLAPRGLAPRWRRDNDCVGAHLGVSSWQRDTVCWPAAAVLPVMPHGRCRRCTTPLSAPLPSPCAPMPVHLCPPKDEAEQTVTRAASWPQRSHKRRATRQAAAAPRRPPRGVSPAPGRARPRGGRRRCCCCWGSAAAAPRGPPPPGPGAGGGASAHERGFSFLPLNSASSDTPATLTTCGRAQLERQGGRGRRPSVQAHASRINLPGAHAPAPLPATTRGRCAAARERAGRPRRHGCAAHLEAHTGDITHGVPAAAEPGDEDLILWRGREEGRGGGASAKPGSAATARQSHGGRPLVALSPQPH
jgi:hypothetical protein